MIGQLELSEAATDRIVVFHHNFFRHDAHIKQIAIKYFLTITEAGIEPGVRVRIADQRNLIAHLQHRIAIRVRQNTVTANTFDIAACLAVNTSSRRFLPSVQSHQFRANPIGADNRQINLAISIGIQTALASNLLGAGLQILML